MPSSQFKIIDRKQKELLVLLPGWAGDYRIFSRLELSYNYAVPDPFWPQDAAEILPDFLRAHTQQPVRLLGLSLGGFVGAYLAAQQPDFFSHVVLVGVRQQYPARDIAMVKFMISRSKEAFLRQFFQQCVSATSLAREWFLPLAEAYCREGVPETLVETLVFLEQLRLTPEIVRAIPRCLFVHGAEDRIAPLSEVESLCREVPAARLVTIKAEGHLPLTHPDFSAEVAAWLRR
ncbi:MAG: alpha/beta hydrolase [Candidatus Omnitrophica bacterium]|nr:alpha/beta hydrolase [Candidatus Omnitrophota bacterium]